MGKVMREGRGEREIKIDSCCVKLIKKKILFIRFGLSDPPTCPPPLSHFTPRL